MTLVKYFIPSIIIILLSILFVVPSTAQECRTSWIVTFNVFTFGGSPDLTATTIDECIDACQSDVSCQGVQVRDLPNLPKTCHRFNVINFGDTFTFLNGYDQYVLQTRCLNSSGCSVKWELSTNTKSRFNGVIYSTINDVATCLATCLQVQGCRGVEMEKTSIPYKCYLFGDRNALIDSTFNRNFNQYLLINQCVDRATGSTTRNTATTIKNIATTPMSSATTTSTTNTASTISSITRNTGVPGIVCWITIPVTQYIGLSSSPFFNVADCQNYCASIAVCFIVNFDTSTNPPCWVQTQIFAFDVNQLVINNAVTTYRKDINCQSTTTPVGGVTTTTATGISTPSACPSPVWTIIRDSKYFGLTSNPETSVVGCRNACIQRLGCTLINFDLSQTVSPCEIQVLPQAYDPNRLVVNLAASTQRLDCNGGVFTSTATVTGTNVVTVTNTEPVTSAQVCTSRWVLTQSTRYTGLSQVNEFSVVSCQNHCLKQLANICFNMNFDLTSNPPCFLQNTPGPYNPANRETATQVNNYQLFIECKDVTTPNVLNCNSWLAFPNNISIGGELKILFSTLPQCQANCISTPTCVGVDFNPSQPTEKCFFHSNPAVFNDIFFDDFATQYRLQRGVCPTTTITGGVTSTTTTTTTTTVTVTTTIITIVTTTTSTNPTTTTTTPGTGTTTTRDPTACLGTVLREHPSTSSEGGISVPARDSQACLEFCLRRNDCVGVDYDRIHGCYYQTDRNLFESTRRLGMSPGVTQFVVQNDCVSIPTTTSTTTTITTGTTTPRDPNSCLGTILMVYQNTSSEGGISVPARDSGACLEFCLRRNDCVGVDYDRIHGCYYQTNRNLFESTRRLRTSPGVTQWVVQNNCVVGPASSAGSTSSTTNNAGRTTSTTTTSNTETTTFFNSKVCVANVLPNTNSFGGILNLQIKTIQKCIDTCFIQPSCIGLDFDIEFFECYLHGDQTAFDNSRQTVSGSRSTQYSIKRDCTVPVPATSTYTSGQTTTRRIRDTTSLPSSKATTISRGPQTCSKSLIPFYQQSAPNANIQPFTKFTQCLSFCLITPGCIGIEFGANRGCFIHNNIISRTPNPSVSIFIISESCSPSPLPDCSYQYSFETSSVGGAERTGITNSVDCLIACSGSRDCIAVDFNNLFNACWLHTDINILSNKVFNPDVTQYVLNRVNCPIITTTASTTTTRPTTTTTTAFDSCFYMWSKTANNGLINGVPQRDLTLESCRARCINNPACTGIDIDNRPGAVFCYIHTTTDLFFFPSIGIDHHQLFREPSCPELITTRTPDVFTTSREATIAQCYVRSLTGVSSNGGERMMDPMDNMTCVYECISRFPTCVAADWRQGDNTCFIHSSLSGRQLNPIVFRYEISCNETSASVAKPPCVDDFAVIINHAPFAQSTIFQNGVRNVEECKARCLNLRSSCLGAVFSSVNNPNPNFFECYLIPTLLSLTTERFTLRYDTFVRRFCVPETAVVLTTTLPPTPPNGFCLLDIVFLIDTSGSIIDNQPTGVSNLRLIRSFINDFINKNNNIGVFLDHVAIVTFDTTARVLYDFCHRQTAYSIRNSGVAKLINSLGITNTPSGFDATTELFRSGKCSRPSARRVIVMITDGKTSLEFKDSFDASLRRIADLGSTRIAIGVTTDVQISELQEFVSPQFQQSIPLLMDFTGLAAQSNTLFNNVVSECGRSPNPGPVGQPPTRPINAITTQEAFNPNNQPATTTTTTLRPFNPPSQNTDFMSFGVFKSIITQNFQSPLIFDQILTSTQNSFDHRRYGFTSASNGGLYMIDVGVGVASGQHAEVDLLVGSNVVNFLSVGSSNQNGVLISGRSTLLYIETSQFVRLQLNNGALQGGTMEKPTTFSVFSLTNTFQQDSVIYAMVATFDLPSSPFSATDYVIPLKSQTASLSFNIVNRNAYECKVSGPHVFSISVKVAGNRFVRLGVEGLEVDFELLSYSTNINAARLISRTFVAPCSQGSRVTVSLRTGEILEAASTSFTAFLYALSPPTSSPQSNQRSDQIWGVYKSYGSNTQFGYALDPFLFDKILVNPGNLYDGNSRTVKIQETGSYYLLTTCGIQRNMQVNMRLVRIRENTNAVENIFYLTSTDNTANGEEMISHGMVVRLSRGDVLKMVADIPSDIYASNRGYETSFVGFFLHS